MNGFERMSSVFNGNQPDRAPFVPSIYEHGAAVLKRTPSEVSLDADLMAAAAVESFRAYDHDLVTVGVDIYNVEAEAFGCRVTRFRDDSIPAISHHPLADQAQLDARVLRMPTAGEGNRLRLIADASAQVHKEIGRQAIVYACMGGPFSQAAELRGFENLLMDMFQEPERVHLLMEKATELSLRQAISLSEQGVGVNLYESWATLPLISPDIFREFVVPYNKRIIGEIRTRFRTPPPAVIMGGNTSLLIDFFIDADASLIAADYNADFVHIRRRIQEAGSAMIVRGCLDPKMIERGDWDRLGPAIQALAGKAAGMVNFAWGCGCVSFTTSKENLLAFKEKCLAAWEKSP